MAGRLTDKIAIVTAAGQGIGRACAMRFAAEGAQVIVNDIRPEAAAAVVGEIIAAGGRATSFVADVGQSERVQAMSTPLSTKPTGQITVANTELVNGRRATTRPIVTMATAARRCEGVAAFGCG